MHREQLIAYYATLPAGTSFVRAEDVVATAAARGLRADARVLDLGCGQGQAAVALALAYPQADVIGIDLSPEQIARAEDRAHAAGVKNAQFFVNDWHEFTLPADGVDLIVATQVLQFMPDERAFAEYLAEGLAPGGLVMLRTVLLPDEEPGRSFVERVMRQFIVGSIRFYSERDVTELLREVGLWRFRIDKEELWLDELPTERQAILARELNAAGLGVEDVQPWFWSGTVSAVRR